MSGMGGYADPSQQYDNLLAKSAYYNAGGIASGLPGADRRDPGDRRSERAQGGVRKAAALRDRECAVLTFLFQTNLLVTQKTVQGVTVDLTNKPRFHSAWFSASRGCRRLAGAAQSDSRQRK